MKLKIADGLSFPLDAVTQALAFLGRRGSGKSYGLVAADSKTLFL